MVQSRCLRPGIVSVTTILQIAGSASLFGWPLLLPPAKFPGTQEPVPTPVVVEASDQVGVLTILPGSNEELAWEVKECPTAVCAPQACTPETVAKLQELMALRARIGTNIGNPQEFQIALASLIEQEQANPSREAVPALVPSAPQQATPNTITWAAPPTNAQPPVNIQPPTHGHPSPPALPGMNCPPTAQPCPPGQPCPPAQPCPPGQPCPPAQACVPVQSHPQVVHWSAVPPQYSCPPNTVQPPTAPVYSQPSTMAVPPMIVPYWNVVPPHIDNATPPQYPQAQFRDPENFVGPRQDVLIQQFPVPQQPYPYETGSPAAPSSIGDGPVRTSFYERNDEVRRNVDRPMDDMVRVVQRPSMGFDQSNRVRQAARRLEEAAWEMEDVGEYSTADDLRRKANELYHRARQQSPVHQNPGLLN